MHGILVGFAEHSNTYIRRQYKTIRCLKRWINKNKPPFLRPKACSVCPFLPLRLQAILPKEKRLLDILKVLEVTRLDMNLGETPEKP